MNKPQEDKIRLAAVLATEQIRLFNGHRTKCEYYRNNNVTGEHNCFYGATKKECNIFICPLKDEEPSH